LGYEIAIKFAHSLEVLSVPTDKTDKTSRSGASAGFVGAPAGIHITR